MNSAAFGGWERKHSGPARNTLKDDWSMSRSGISLERFERGGSIPGWRETLSKTTGVCREAAYLWNDLKEAEAFRAGEKHSQRRLECVEKRHISRTT
jgi:hypothetical protein